MKSGGQHHDPVPVGHILWALAGVSAHAVGSLLMTLLGLATVAAFKSL